MNFDSLYTKEWLETIERIRQENSNLKSLEYFLHLGEMQGDEDFLKDLAPKVILFGLNYPKEILNAVVDQPFYLCGGSFVASEWSESMVPRDTDSGVKSILGVLLKEEWALAKEAMILIPITCDSMRKVADLLQKDYNVLTIEVPNDMHDSHQIELWKTEVRRILAAIEKHTGHRASSNRIKKCCHQSGMAKEAWKRLNEAFLNGCLALNGTARMFVANSYFWAADIEDWANHINLLLVEAEKMYQEQLSTTQQSSILLIGSPIYAPNYKIPFLLDELGIRIGGSIHPMEILLSGKRDKYSLFETKNTVVDILAEDLLAHDMSPAYVENEVMLKAAKELLEKNSFDGVVFHILKGQIEYDFELRKLDEYLTHMNLPIFRLETDYNYQDIEQLRIRLEAFGEMLDHRRELRKQETVKDVA